MKLPEKSVDSAFVQRYVDVVHANGFGCRIEEQPDSNTFLVSINNQRMRFPDTIPGRVEAASFINTNMLQMKAAMHKLLTMMQYCNNVNIGLAEPVKQEKNPAGDIFSVKLSGVYEPVKESKLYEQEMIAKAQEARAEVIQAEAEVPKALAQALRDGNMGFMDYYRLENLKGDTAMRENISKLTKNDLGSLIK